MGSNQGQQGWAAIALLADELRQRLYRFVRAQPAPVTRDQAAAATGISRKLAAFHPDKLLAAGLLVVAAPVPAIRPRDQLRTPKGLDRTGEEITLSVPQRRYDMLGVVLTEAMLA